MKKILILLLAFNASVFSQEMITNNNSFKRELASWQFGVASYDELLVLLNNALMAIKPQIDIAKAR